MLNRRSIGEGVELAGAVPTALFPRLVDLGFAAEGGERSAIFRLRAHWSGYCIRVTGTVSADLDLVCQRCLKPMTFAAHSRMDVGVVRDEAEALRLPAELEPIIGPEADAVGYEGGGITVLQLLEEELLLAAPTFPVHRDGENCGASRDVPARGLPGKAAEDAFPEPGRANPFGVLARLKQAH